MESMQNPGEARLPFLRFSERYVDREHACHVSSEWDRQLTDLQRDALLAAGIDGRYLFEDHASGAKDNWPGWLKLWRSKERLFFGKHLLGFSQRQDDQVLQCGKPIKSFHPDTSCASSRRYTQFIER
jgi:hypothetical protein